MKAENKPPAGMADFVHDGSITQIAREINRLKKRLDELSADPPSTTPSTTSSGLRPPTWALTSVSAGMLPGFWTEVALIVQKIKGAAIGGTVTFNIEIRSDYDASGTDIMTADMAADTSEPSVTSFAVSVIPAQRWVIPHVASADAGVTAFSATLVVK